MVTSSLLSAPFPVSYVFSALGDMVLVDTVQSLSIVRNFMTALDPMHKGLPMKNYIVCI